MNRRPSNTLFLALFGGAVVLIYAGIADTSPLEILQRILTGAALPKAKGSFTGSAPLPGEAPASGRIAELFGPCRNSVGGHEGHGHFASTDCNLVASVGYELQRRGFVVSQNKHFGGVDAVHVDNSYHYRGPDGRVRADKQGCQAIDFNWPGENERQKLCDIEDELMDRYGTGSGATGPHGNQHK